MELRLQFRRCQEKAGLVARSALRERQFQSVRGNAALHQSQAHGARPVESERGRGALANDPDARRWFRRGVQEFGQENDGVGGQHR
jgi:hypothetical protein